MATERKVFQQTDFSGGVSSYPLIESDKHVADCEGVDLCNVVQGARLSEAPTVTTYPIASIFNTSGDYDVYRLSRGNYLLSTFDRVFSLLGTVQELLPGALTQEQVDDALSEPRGGGREVTGRQRVDRLIKNTDGEYLRLVNVIGPYVVCRISHSVIENYSDRSVLYRIGELSTDGIFDVRNLTLEKLVGDPDIVIPFDEGFLSKSTQWVSADNSIYFSAIKQEGIAPLTIIKKVEQVFLTEESIVEDAITVPGEARHMVRLGDYISIHTAEGFRYLWNRAADSWETQTFVGVNVLAARDVGGVEYIIYEKNQEVWIGAFSGTTLQALTRISGNSIGGPKTATANKIYRRRTDGPDKPVGQVQNPSPEDVNPANAFLYEGFSKEVFTKNRSIFFPVKVMANSSRGGRSSPDDLRSVLVEFSTEKNTFCYRWKTDRFEDGDGNMPNTGNGKGLLFLEINEGSDRNIESEPDITYFTISDDKKTFVESTVTMLGRWEGSPSDTSTSSEFISGTAVRRKGYITSTTIRGNPMTKKRIKEVSVSGEFFDPRRAGENTSTALTVFVSIDGNDDFLDLCTFDRSEFRGKNARKIIGDSVPIPECSFFQLRFEWKQALGGGVSEDILYGYQVIYEEQQPE